MKVRLKDAFDLQMGKTPARNMPAYWDGEHKWISIADIGCSGKYITTTKERITDKAITESGIRAVPARTVIMSFKLSIGKTAITSEEMYTNEAIMAFVNKETYDIDTDYLYHLCCGTEWTEGTNKAVMGLTLNKATLSEKRISLPEITEQRNIAAKFDALDNVIEKTQAELSSLDQLVKSRFVEMFGDPAQNPMGWPMRRLSDVCTKLTDGTHFSPESFPEGDYKYITAKNIKIDGFDFSDLTYVPESVHRPIYERCDPEYGDILYIKDGATTGIAMINSLDEEFTMLSSVALLKHDRSIINGQYLKALLNFPTFYHSMRSNMGGAAITRLTIKKLCATSVPVPPIEHQEAFATFVIQSDKSKLAVQQSLEKLETLKKSLMQQYFG